MIYEIKSESASAKIDSFGAQWISFLGQDKTEYVWQRDEAHWSLCAPVLFPIVARARKGNLIIGGKPYEMIIHGFASNTEFEVVDQKKNEITFRITSNEETKQSYPFDFEFFVRFAVEGKTLTNEFRVVNTGNTDMYFGVGGHPGYNCPLDQGEKFEDYQLVFECEEPLYSNHVMDDEAISATQKDLMSENGRISLHHDLFLNDAMIFEGLKSKKVKLCSKNTGRGVEVDFGQFPSVGVWTRATPSDAPYVCIEPWYSMGFRDNEGDDLEKKKDIVCLGSGKEFKVAFTVTQL